MPIDPAQRGRRREPQAAQPRRVLGGLAQHRGRTRGHALFRPVHTRGIAPVVTTAGALPELVGDTGIVVPDTDALALALQELIAEPERGRELGQRARRRILEEFSDSPVAERTLLFWREVVRA